MSNVFSYFEYLVNIINAIYVESEIMVVSIIYTSIYVPSFIFYTHITVVS